ncbi:MAG TPA: DUF2147 domain-containing protein [Bradyrhizobium sp.]|nr:DUF2147 domain-containing protein [Bradyrhizobium sp.]
MKIVCFAATAALLLASTAAHAGSNGNSLSFEIEGQKVHIEVPKHCDSLNCIQISAPGLAKSGFNLKGLNFGKSDNDDTADSNPPAKAAPAPAIAPSAPAPTAAPQTQAAAPSPAPAAPAPQTIASTTPAPVLHDVIPAAPPPPHAATSAPAAQGAAAAAPVATPVTANTPIGIWKTEDDKGDVRIEQCGADLCGYAVGSGEKILINMRADNSKWVGRIHDPDSGRNYDSTIAMKGANTLRVQGCAFGGLFCGGQTWKRVS